MMFPRRTSSVSGGSRTGLVSNWTKTSFCRRFIIILIVCSLGLFGTFLRLIHIENYYSSILSDSKDDFNLTLWSSDFHISPVADIKQIVSDMGVRVIDKSLSGHCHLSNTCARDLRVIDQQNGIYLTPCTNSLRIDFYSSYREDPEMLLVDAFLCTHANSMCELFMPFGKPMVIIVSTRYEIGRHDKIR